MTILSALASEKAAPSAQKLEAYLRAHIASGALANGARLPPVREAAWQLGCAPGTVSRAYQALTVAGLVHGAVGRGTFVGTGPPPRLVHMRDEDMPDIADMAINTFLMEPAGDLLRAALEAAGAEAQAGTLRHGYFGVMGERADRAAALPLLSRWRKDAAVEGIALFNGAQAAISAAVAGLMRPGTSVAADALTYPGVMAAAELSGRRVIGIEADALGMLPEALEAACRTHAVSLLVVMPGIHNPTGLSMPQARREALAEVAARHDLTVLEDEVYGFLVDDPAASFSSLLPGRAVVATSLSKCVAPALHVGYAAGPTGLIRRMATAHNAMLLMVSPLLSAAASYVFRSGALDKRVAAIRAGVADRAAFVAERLPGLRAEDLRGGLAWLSLPDGWRVADFCAEAEAQGVRVGDGKAFAVERSRAPQAVRLSFCAVPGEARFRAAIDKIADLHAHPMPSGAALP